jgi:hypothetical protein
MQVRFLFNFRQTLYCESTVFQNMTLCSLVEVYQLFGGTCCFHLQGKKLSYETKKQSALPSACR